MHIINLATGRVKRRCKDEDVQKLLLGSKLKLEKKLKFGVPRPIPKRFLVEAAAAA